jgi:signal transduction histidine kinase
VEIIILAVACIVNLALGAFVFLQNPKASYARSFAFLSVSICIWVIANYITNYHWSNLIINDIANKLAYVGGYCILLSQLIFTYNFPVKRIVNKFEAVAVAIISFFIISLSLSVWVAGEVTYNPSIGLQYSVGPLLWLYVLGFMGVLALIAKNLLSSSNQSDRNRKIQARLILVSFCICVLAGLLLNAIIPSLTNNWYTTRFGPLATVAFVGTIVYAITRRGLFDVRLAAVRTLAYILSLATMAVAYYYIAYVISLVFFQGNTSSSVSFSPVNITLALLLAFIFQPVKRFFDKVTNNFFYKDNYNTDDFFARLNRSLSLTTDLRGLLERAAYEIGHTLKSEQTFFFINTADGHYVSSGTSGHKQLPKSDVVQMGEFYKENQGVIVASLLDTDNPTRRMMLSHRIELMLPLVQDEKIVGYLCLGDHLTSGYTHRDLKALNTISNELVIAIQNALSVQEVRELNATLQQRVNNATKELRASNVMLRKLDKVKDEFVSIASHQLRTPLTSVKGYISMVLDGDAGDISDSQRHLLDEAFISSERMVHLINDFLNVSRLQTGKFIIDRRPVDLSKIVGQEIDSLQPTALSRNLKYVYHPPKNFPILDIDEGKIRQVIMNFADNSLYYSHEGTKIIVTLSVDRDEVLFTVKDTGIGVPIDEQAQLFGKFYRASNAKKQRPDGTGVGLFLAKKVIDAHGGQVVFESVEGKGSTFGFRLPIKPLESASADDTNNLDN